MTTPEQLQRYNAFDADIIQAVSDVAEAQASCSYGDLAARYNLADGPQHAKPFSESGHSVQYLHLKPQTDYDTTKARILLSPMGTPVDQNMAMRAMRLFAADPSEQLYIFGTAAHIGNRHNRPPTASLREIAQGNLTGAVILPTVFLARTAGITQIDTLGYSYGADTAAAMTSSASTYGIEARRGVWAESAAMFPRKVTELLADFARSGAELDRYVAEAGSPSLYEARQAADVGMRRYALGLLRVSNLAIASALAGGTFQARAERALRDNPDLRSTIAWGTASEMTHDETARALTDSLAVTFGAERVRSLVVEGMHHAGADNINLHAAIMLQGLKNATSA